VRLSSSTYASKLPIAARCYEGDVIRMNDVDRPVLLVEDNEDDQILIQAAFESAGIHCRIVVLGTAEEAIAHLSRVGEVGEFSQTDAAPMPAVVLIDLSLPGKSGHDLLKWIQGRKQLQSLVRVVLSGSENPDDVDKSYRLGAHGYLMKPITAHQLNQPGRTLKTILLQMGTVPQPA